MNIFLIVLIILWVADAVTTVIALYKGAFETNPALAYIFNKWGEYGFFFLKFLLCAIVVVCMYYAQNIYFNYFAVILYVFVVANNIYQIWKLNHATV